MFKVLDEVRVVSSEFAMDDNYVGCYGTVMFIDNDDELNVCVDIGAEAMWFNDKELELVKKN